MQPVQMRMARAALGLSIDDLANAAGLSTATVTALEQGGSLDSDATEALSLFLSNRGIQLLDGDGVRAPSTTTGQFVTVDELTTGNDGGEG